MLTVRAPMPLETCSAHVHRRCTREPTSRHSHGLQEEVRWHQSTDHDLLFECWAVADRLDLHALAAQCEWGLTQLWEAKHVYARAALDLSPGALQRVARSLSAGKTGAYKQYRNLLEVAQNPMILGRPAKLDLASKYKVATESAQTMMQWRMSKE